MSTSLPLEKHIHTYIHCYQIIYARAAISSLYLYLEGSKEIQKQKNRSCSSVPHTCNDFESIYSVLYHVIINHFTSFIHGQRPPPALLSLFFSLMKQVPSVIIPFIAIGVLDIIRLIVLIFIFIYSSGSKLCTYIIIILHYQPRFENQNGFFKLSSALCFHYVRVKLLCKENYGVLTLPAPDLHHICKIPYDKRLLLYISDSERCISVSWVSSIFIHIFYCN